MRVFTGFVVVVGRQGRSFAAPKQGTDGLQQFGPKCRLMHVAKREMKQVTHVKALPVVASFISPSKDVVIHPNSSTRHVL